MNRLDLGKLWLQRLYQAMPDRSKRLTIRFAWHLAALSVYTDKELAQLPEAALLQSRGRTTQFVELRNLYLRRISVSLPSGARLVRPGSQRALAAAIREPFSGNWAQPAD